VAQQPTQQADQSDAPAQPDRVTVHGIVRNQATGEPLARALVQIEGDADTGTLTDGEGRFGISNLPVGPQIIRIAKPGFRDRPYATEETGLQAEGPARSVLVAAQMPELDFALTPDCAIHGHIELSTGDPADNIPVVLLKQVVRSGRALWAQINTTRTNGDGNYRFGSLPDGTYAVSTQPTLESEPAVNLMAAGSAAHISRSGYPAVFYPDARDLAGASRIRLANGSQAEASFSLRLEPFYPVSFVAGTQDTAAAKDGRQGNFTAVFMDATNHPLPYVAQYDGTTHTLQANLPDGTYIVVVRGFQMPGSSGDDVAYIGPGERRIALRGQGALAGSLEFTVAGHAVTGLRVPLAPPPTAAVRLRFVHSADAPAGSASNGNGDQVNLTIDPAEGAPLNSGQAPWSINNEPDAITFTAQPGSYWLTAFPGRKGLCAGPITGGGINPAREPLTMSLATPPPPMELTLSDGCGTLALTLPPALATFLPGEEPFYTVYMVPDFDTVVDIPPMTMHPSSGATLPIDSLTPGSYHIYTFASPVHLEFRNPAALAAMNNAGQQVTVSAGTTTNLVLEAPEH